MKLRFLTPLALLAAVSAMAQQASDTIVPEQATTVASGTLVKAKNYMVVAANPLASQAGADVLAKGGTAIDAMVAVQTVLGLVEPQSSGLGGGAFLVYYDAAKGELTTFDGRETAPMEATPTLFLDDKGQPLEFFDAVVGGRSVGTPGTVKLLNETHTSYGKLPWKDLFQPAIRLAKDGFAVPARLSALIAEEGDKLKTYPGTAAYFFDAGGAPLKAGAILKNPDYAATLTAIAEGGADAFYKGKIAEDIVDTVRMAPKNPGVLSLSDLANYRIKERKPVCIAYRALDVCGMGPPSSGALAVGQILGMSEHFDLKALGKDNPESWRIIGDAQRLAFADRGRYMADVDFVPMPVKGLLDKTYLDGRAALLNGDKALAEDAAVAGEPEWQHAMLLGDDRSIELPSTSHFVIVDSFGNVLSMTTTIENGFGSRLMTHGFLLNNELTDFSFETHAKGVPIANRVEPGKRPRSSMAPTIVLKNGKPVLAIGSPGGSQIIGYVAQALIAQIDWGLDVQQAVSMPHLVNRFGRYDIEAGTSAETLKGPLEALGYEVKVTDMNSGLHAIEIGPDGLSGGADPRREGVAIGD